MDNKNGGKAGYEYKLTAKQEKELIRVIREGTPDEREAAWERIYKEFEGIIAEKAYDKMKVHMYLKGCKWDINLENDLVQEGYLRLVKAVNSYDLSEKYKLTTYAFKAIEYGINAEYKRICGHGIKYGARKKSVKKRVDTGYAMINIPASSSGEVDLTKAEEQGKYSDERLAIQLLDVIREYTDKKQPLPTREIRRLLQEHNENEHGNPTVQGDEDGKTINRILAELLFEESDRLGVTDKDYFEKIKMNTKEGLEVRVKSAPACQGIYYKHLFSDSEMDRLVQMVCLSEEFSLKEKNAIVGKLLSTKNKSYRDNNPLWNGKEIKFNPKGIHGRYKSSNSLSGNINTIQDAINKGAQISFVFNRYTEDKKLVPTTGNTIIVNPYHIVIYHDNYYLLCTYRGGKKINHFRLDLMSDVKIRKFEGTDMFIPLEITSFDDIPTELRTVFWNPSKYLAEHLYMGFDKPCLIEFRAKKTQNRIFTTFHDWFDDNFDSYDDPENEDSIILSVRTSPSLVVPFALQYSDMFEVVNPEIREEIKKKIKELKKKYV